FTFSFGAINLDLSNSEATRDVSSVLAVDHNGERQKSLSALEIGPDGNVWATYGADEAVSLGQIAIGAFNDLQGLTSIGSATYLESRVSGSVRLGGAGENGYGVIRSGSVEQANVDLTDELVNLIVAQRNYQASAKALETNGKLSETIMNIRS
ncbi:MAG: flagellar hook-basal body complex protein, partial [Phaeobacter gallaeciensis]